MSIAIEDWGAAPDGQRVQLATLRNDAGAWARVSSFGATLVGFALPDRAGKHDDVVLGFDTLAGYLGPHPYFGGSIGRFAGRIRDARLTLDGNLYAIARNDGDHHLHGGQPGFDRRAWNLRVEDGVVVCALHAADGEQGFPGVLQVEARYRLDAAGALHLEYRARSDAPTVLNLANHAYFNLAGRGDVLDHHLQVAAARFLPIDAGLVPTGVLQDVRGTPMDLRVPTRLADAFARTDAQLALGGGGFDHCWALDDPTGALRPVATLSHPPTGRALAVWTTQPGLQVYTGNQLDGRDRGKHGAAYARHAGLCLETQHFPNAPNVPAFPGTVLRPGEEFLQRTRLVPGLA